MISLHETCQQYVKRRLSEGWRIISQIGFNVILQSPDGIIRPVDLRNDVETLRPNEAGSETSIPSQFPNSTYHWDKVDEETPDDDGTYVFSTYTPTRDLYNLPAHSVGSGTINSIKIYFRFARGSAGVAYTRPSQKSGTTVTDGEEITNSSQTYITSSQTYTANPATGVAYTWDEIDTLQIGIVLRTSGSNKCTQVYVEVDYTLGAIIIERTLNEALGAVSDNVGINRYHIPSISVADSPAYNLQRTVVISEPSVSVSDAVALILRRTVVISEPSVSVSDAVALILRRTVVISEPSVSVSDAVALILRRIRDISEPSISASDGVVAEKITPFTPRDVNEPAISVSDAISYLLTRAVSIAEAAISVADATDRALTRNILISEPSISVADLVAKALIRVQGISEPGISVGDSLAYNLYRAAAINEPPLSVADVVSYILRRVVVVNEPAISITDSALAILIRLLSVSEPAISLVDAVAYVLQRAIGINEPAISISDVASYLLQRAVAVNEPAISVADSPLTALIKTWYVSISEPGITVSDLIEAGHFFSRGISESIGAAAGAFPIIGGSHIIEIIGEE